MFQVPSSQAQQSSNTFIQVNKILEDQNNNQKVGLLRKTENGVYNQNDQSSKIGETNNNLINMINPNKKPFKVLFGNANKVTGVNKQGLLQILNNETKGEIDQPANDNKHMHQSTTYNYRDKSQSLENKMKKNLCSNPAQFLAEDTERMHENERHTTSQGSFVNGGMSVCIREEEDFTNVGNLIDEIKDDEITIPSSQFIKQNLRNASQSLKVQFLEQGRKQINIQESQQQDDKIDNQEIATNLMETRHLAVCSNDDDQEVKSYMKSLLFQSKHNPSQYQQQKQTNQSEHNNQNLDTDQDEIAYNYASNSTSSFQQLFSKQRDNSCSSINLERNHIKGNNISVNLPNNRINHSIDSFQRNQVQNNNQFMQFKGMILQQKPIVTPTTKINLINQTNSQSKFNNQSEIQDLDNPPIQGISLLKQFNVQSMTKLQNNPNGKKLAIQCQQDNQESQKRNEILHKLYDDIPIEGSNQKQGLVQQVYISPTSNKSKQIHFQTQNQITLLTEQSSAVTLNTWNSAEKSQITKGISQIGLQNNSNINLRSGLSQERQQNDSTQQGIKIINNKEFVQDKTKQKNLDNQHNEGYNIQAHFYNQNFSVSSNAKQDTQSCNNNSQNISISIPTKRSNSNYQSIDSNQYNTINSNPNKSLERKKKIFEEFTPHKQQIEAINIPNFLQKGTQNQQNAPIDKKQGQESIQQNKNVQQPFQFQIKLNNQNEQDSNIQIAKEFDTERNCFQPSSAATSYDTSFKVVYRSQSKLHAFQLLQNNLEMKQQMNIQPVKKECNLEQNQTKLNQLNSNSFQKNKDQFIKQGINNPSAGRRVDSIQQQQLIRADNNQKEKQIHEINDEFQTSTIDEQSYDIQVKQLEPFKFNKFILQQNRQNKFESDTQSTPLNQSSQSNERVNQNLTIKHVQGQNTTAASFLEDLSILKNGNQQLQTTFEIENILGSDLKKEQLPQVQQKQKRLIFETGSSRNNSSQRTTINSAVSNNERFASLVREQNNPVQVLGQNNKLQNQSNNSKILILKDQYLTTNTQCNTESSTVSNNKEIPQKIKIIQQPQINAKIQAQQKQQIHSENSNQIVQIFPGKNQLINNQKSDIKSNFISCDQKRKAIFYNTERKKITNLAYLGQNNL